jgi:uncharacterized protein with HEPN domain
VSRAQLLDALEATLLRIESLTPADKALWDTDEVLRLAVERLWITAGNTAEEHRRTAGVAPGIDPWAQLYTFRSVLAHALPDELSSDRVWAETTAELLDRVRAAT